VRVLVICALLLLSSFGGLVTYLADESTWIWRDDDNPNAALVVPLRLNKNSVIPADQIIDFSQINGGDWTHLCMTGHYNRPVSELYRIREKQGIITPVKVSRWTNFRMGEPPPCCTGMAFTDRNHQLHFLRLTGGFEPLKALIGNDECLLRENPIWKPTVIRQPIR
jgi:hypothetical protein